MSTSSSPSPSEMERREMCWIGDLRLSVCLGWEYRTYLRRYSEEEKEWMIWYTFFMGKQIPSDNFIILRWLKSGELRRRGNHWQRYCDDHIVDNWFDNDIKRAETVEESPGGKGMGQYCYYSVYQELPRLFIWHWFPVFFCPSLSLEISISRMSSPLCDFHGCFLITLWTRTRPEPHDEIIIIVTIQSVSLWP